MESNTESDVMKLIMDKSKDNTAEDDSSSNGDDDPSRVFIFL